MILLGLLLLVAAVVIAVAGVLSNIGSSHLLTRSFEILGFHITGSTGRLLLIGVILGAAGMLGLNLLLAGLGRGIKRRVSTRRQLKADHKDNERLAAERDQLSRQLEDERRDKLAAGASVQNGGTAGESAGGVGAREVRTTRRVSE
jgi:hypothetical protein